MTSSIEFEKPFKYKLIYIFTIGDEAHKNLLKIGDTTINTNKTPDQLLPNCDDLKASAEARINHYTQTAGIEYILLHTELAITEPEDKSKSESFRDYDVHRI